MPSYPKIEVSELRASYDYIIVGGGTAGCVLANRLSQKKDTTVLLVERGAVGDSWIARVPLFSAHFASDGSRSRVWQSTPQVHLDGRSINLVGGNSLGGSSTINATLYTRGLPAEYNSWKEICSAEEWKYDNFQPYLVKSERNLDRKTSVQEYHGSGGEWAHRSHDNLYWRHSEHIIKATSALGLPYVEDPNSPVQPSHGCSKLHHSIDSYGRRSATSYAFLPKHVLKSRLDRLHICTNTVVHRVQISEDSYGTVAQGVWVQRSDATGATRFVSAKKEVILTAGPVGSPHLILLSGIGPEKHLEEHGIAVMKHLPGVGSHLQDHLAVPVQFQVPLFDSLAKLELRPWLVIKEIFLYIIFGIGLLLSPVLELSVFVQTRLLDEDSRVTAYTKSDLDGSLPKNRPDIEIMPISWGDVTKHRQGGLSFFAVTLRPTSLGTVRLASSDPFASPNIDPNYFSTENDRAVMRKGIRFALRMKEEMANQGYPIVESRVPIGNTDAELDTFMNTECQSTNHYSSTCRMAPESEGGVVDERLRVYGVKNLRIADSSIFPEILSTHVAAPTVAVAEKCSDMVLEDARVVGVNGLDG